MSFDGIAINKKNDFCGLVLDSARQEPYFLLKKVSQFHYITVSR